MAHIPFRSWCAHCVRGKAKNNPHAKRIDDVDATPTVSIDCMHMGEEEGEGKAHDAKEKDIKEIGMLILVMKDHESKMVQASVVPEKGQNSYAIKRLMHDIGMLGYKKMIPKSDNEKAILALKACVKREKQDDIILEEAPVG